MLQKFHAGLLVPILREPWATGSPFPIGRNGIAQRSALELLEFSEFGGLLGGVVSERRRWPELARRGQNPGLPGSHHWQNRVRAVPLARPGRDAAGPLRVRAIRFSALDHLRRHLAPEFEARAHVARIGDARNEQRAARLLGPFRKEF